MMRLLLSPLLCLIALIFLTTDAFACTNPAGNAGDTIYNKDFNVMQYCDTTNWIAMNNEDNGLVGYWRLDETSGTTATDSSVNSNNGTMTSGLDASNDSVTGVIENALDFDGTDDRIVVIPTDDLRIRGNLTTSIWVYRNSNATQQSVFDMADNGEASGDNHLYQLTILPTDVIRFEWEYNSGTNININSTVPLSSGLNTWAKISVTRNTNTNEVIFYENGVQLGASRPFTSLPTDGSNAFLTIGDSSGPVGTGEDSFDGIIDEFRIYNRVLSPAEITQLYNAGRDRRLVAHWKLDETAGTTAVDSSINNNNGTLANMDGTTNTISGKVDTGFQFNGTDEAVTIPPTPENIEDLDIFTLSAWVYPEIQGLQERILSPGSGTFDLQVSVGGQLTFIVDTSNNGGSNLRIGTVSAVQANKWYHMTGTYDGTTMRFYLDGIEIDSRAQSGLVNDGNGWGIGGTPLNGQNYAGRIDDARIYNRALSANEVQALYRERFNTCTSPDGHEGDIIYNDTNNIMQYCNAHNWAGMGPDGNGGAGCSNPIGAVGDMIYNDAFNVMQYCEGDDWVAIGK